MEKQKLNYGLNKSDFKPDKSRISWDYIKGIIDTDGCIQNKRKGDYSVVISQSHPTYLEALNEFIENQKNIKGKIYMEGRQLSFSNKEFLNFILSYKILDYDSYFAGIIDGDGSFCSHISKSGKYWRFGLGASKERKIIIFEKLFEYFNLKPIIWQNKKVKMFGIQKTEDIIFLLSRIKGKLIVKQFVGDKVLSELIERKKLLKQDCIFCGLEFDRKLAKGHNLKKICDRKDCRKRFHRERMRKYRFKIKQATTQIYTHINPEDLVDMMWEGE